jgi:hypothetical protein
VRRVAAGEVPDFRVQPTAEGAALMRIAESGGGHRVANIEEVVALDEAGQVVGTYNAD